jgi:diketogulonate reductase-like aldo/keto reductase
MISTMLFLCMQRLRASLAKLGVPSVDLVLLQWEEGLDDTGARGAGLLDAALWMSDLQQAGMTKGVGVANLDVPHMLQVRALLISNNLRQFPCFSSNVKTLQGVHVGHAHA